MHLNHRKNNLRSGGYGCSFLDIEVKKKQCQNNTEYILYYTKTTQNIYCIYNAKSKKKK